MDVDSGLCFKTGLVVSCSIRFCFADAGNCVFRVELFSCFFFFPFVVQRSLLLLIVLGCD